VNDLLDLVARQVAADLRNAPAAARRHFSEEGRAERCRSIDDLRRMARRTVPKPVFDYVDGAAWGEVTYRRNRSAFDALALRPRALVDVSEIELATTVLGRRIDLPIIAPPTGLTGLTHPDGEAAIARAAHALGTIYTQSALSSVSIEEVHAAAPGPKWFQLYVMTDRGLVRDMLARAQAAGHEALVLTVDVAVAGVRERDVRNRFSVPPRLTARAALDGLLRPRWSAGFVTRPRITPGNLPPTAGGAAGHAQFVNRSFDPTVTWEDLATLREQWEGPLVIKGIMRADDAERAVRHGVEAIIVSNHGGRQLDHAQASIEALPAIAEAVGDRAEIYLDSGVRRGTDIIKALALGARAVLVGRPLVYGLGAAGEAGARRALELLRAELATALALAGYPRIAELGPDAVVR
jgi:L-lactate dehydrogenase (cytochrome)